MTVTIAPYEDHAAPAVATLWNEEFGSRYPLAAELLLARCGPMPGTTTLGWIARRNGEVSGALLLRLPALPWFPLGVGFVTLFVVARRARRRGLGRALLERAVEEARARGYRALVFGGGPGHLVPGVPAEAPLATWRFLRQAGAVPREVFHDLLVDLTIPLEPPQYPVGVELAPAPREPMLAFLAKEFPGEWEVDVATAYDAGATVYGLWRHGSLIGFAATHRPGEWPPAPSLFWSTALDGSVAGLGPLGIAADERGRGLGLAMVRGALHELARTGARWAIIDWTELAPFYGRAGAHVWRTYQMAALPLDRS
ncbi:MAG: GNAT family N-acetyltransferase [Thermomicrobium sp.]|nr:GNAT family N-acetyltransferase [Thermomicrobium sp.]